MRCSRWAGSWRHAPELQLLDGGPLVGEIVEDEALGSPKGLDGSGGVGSVVERDGRKLEAGDPALGSAKELGKLLGIRLTTQRL